MVATRTADRPRGSGSCVALQRAAERRPLGPKTGARAREVEEQVSHAGLRAQKTPPPGGPAGHPAGALAAEK